jgi:hypothetical protein
VDFYSTEGDHGVLSGTIAVVKMSEMDALAETVRRLGLTLSNQLSSVEGIQCYERYTRPGNVFFDLDDFLIHNSKESRPNEYNDFLAQLGRTVIYAGHTDSFYSAAYANSGFVTVNHFSGLNVFIPWSRTTPLIPEYQKTNWYKTVYTQ